ncbi:hypothetical protein [Streptomyces sp. SID13588]|uniref:hypothetical protein n=1 Tax=Streptomyces sp. SID13588 TaxID=2706051 RepID=UPI001EF196AF|nr:hypothetical protein [Streptomyces sp. SID13588]
MKYGPGQAQKLEGHDPSTGGEMYLRGLNRWQAEEQREDMADLYVESSITTPGNEYRGREVFLRRLAEDVSRPGFDMMVAEATVAAEAPTVVGCIFGHPVQRDGSWWEGFQGELRQDIEQLTASGHLFAITEIVIHPHEQHRGLAGRLQERLLGEHEATLAVTKVDEADHARCAAFRSWGWQDIGQASKPSDPGFLRVLVLPLGERSPGVPDGLAHNAGTERPGEADAQDPGMRS